MAAKHSEFELSLQTFVNYFLLNLAVNERESISISLLDRIKVLNLETKSLTKFIYFFGVCTVLH